MYCWTCCYRWIRIPFNLESKSSVNNSLHTLKHDNGENDEMWNRKPRKWATTIISVFAISFYLVQIEITIIQQLKIVIISNFLFNSTSDTRALQTNSISHDVVLFIREKLFHPFPISYTLCKAISIWKILLVSDSYVATEFERGMNWFCCMILDTEFRRHRVIRDYLLD